MTKDAILDYVLERHETGSPMWRAWREARDKYGYRKTYAAYLATDQWRNFRDAVIKAANGKCQCCLVREPSEVHHLSYKYVFFENAGFVQAVCRPCHETMSGIENYDRRDG